MKESATECSLTENPQVNQSPIVSERSFSAASQPMINATLIPKSLFNHENDQYGQSGHAHPCLDPQHLERRQPPVQARLDRDGPGTH